MDTGWLPVTFDLAFRWANVRSSPDLSQKSDFAERKS